MKSWLNKSFIFLLGSLALMSCEKDEDMAILTAGTSPTLNVSATSLVLNEETPEDDAITFSWGKADFGYEAAVEYSLEIDTAGNNFWVPYSESFGSALSKTYTVEELNTLLTKLKYEPEEAHDIRFRVKASVSDKVAAAYSPAQTVSITTYSTFVEPSFIYVPGAYQGWDPATAPSLISVQSDGIYQGIITFEKADELEFKFTVGRGWDVNYGAGATDGSLAPGGGNLKVAAPESYKLTVDLNQLTWSAAKHSWGVIGDATPGKWDTDTNMKYSNEEGVWKVTLDLVPGKIKFRLNDDWGTNYGDDDTSNSVLNAGGADIPVAEAGTYEIILDLENEDGSATYTVTKQ